MTNTANNEQDAVAIYLSRSDALKIADFLDAYGDESDEEIAANIRYQASAKESEQ